MARDELMTKAITAGAVLLGYQMAGQGSFGSGLKQFHDQIAGALKGTIGGAAAAATTIAQPGSPTPTGSTVLPPPQPRPGPGGTVQCPPFIPGVQYTADRHDGTFETVVGGRLVYVGDQATAEATFRHYFGCG